MPKLAILLTIITLLAACGSPANKRVSDRNNQFISALVAQDQNKITSRLKQISLSQQNNTIINLYLMAVKDQPYQLMSHGQQVVKDFRQYNPAQQRIIKPLLLWAYAHPIYRQETAKQVRLLQRETLLVAPSDINFVACESRKEGCSNTLRAQVADILSPKELTEILEQMAHNDPCINLSDENVGGEAGNHCLASRKGDLKINLISRPQFLFAQWQAMLDSQT